jgi:hypothetical protein
MIQSVMAVPRGVSDMGDILSHIETNTKNQPRKTKIKNHTISEKGMSPIMNLPMCRRE